MESFSPYDSGPRSSTPLCRTEDRYGPGPVPDLQFRGFTGPENGPEDQAREDRPRTARGPVPACQDCTGTAHYIEIEPGVIVIEIRHDPTCPFYRARSTR